MLAIFALSLLIFTQMTQASSSDDDRLDVRDLSHLLDAEKRYATSVRECTLDPVDLGLIIDSSRSISLSDFAKGLQFLASFLDEFDIGQGTNQTRVAAVSFGHVVFEKDRFNFTTYSTKQEVKDHVLNMTHQLGDTTQTGKAIKYMREFQLQMRRPGVAQIEIVITDGRSRNGTETAMEAMKTKESNITVFAVGVKNSVKNEELVNIAGGVSEHVFQASSYSELGENFKNQITQKTCTVVPVPTTTTVPSTTTTQVGLMPAMEAVPSTPAAQPCGQLHPTDINFVFSANTMDLEEICNVTSFISNVTNQDELNEGFQYGVVSGDCPDDEGFRLNQYQNSEAIREHLERYNRNNLPHVVQRATETGFTTENGARVTKTAVIFLGNKKVNGKELGRAIKRMQASGVQVFVSASDYKTLIAVAPCLPSKVTLLNGDTFSQATQLVNHLCPEKFDEGNLPDCEYDHEECARS